MPESGVFHVCTGYRNTGRKTDRNVQETCILSLRLVKVPDSRPADCRDNSGNGLLVEPLREGCVED